MNIYLKTAVLIFLTIIFTSGCATYMVLDDSRAKISYRRAVARGDQNAIRAFDAGNGAVGVGVNLLNWETLREQPLWQFLAAIWDAATIYFADQGIKNLNGNDKGNQTTITVNADNYSTVNVDTGNNNTSNTETEQKENPK